MFKGPIEADLVDAVGDPQSPNIRRAIRLWHPCVDVCVSKSRGGAARGASTITQQLAKNLFLSRDKQLGRKLQELAITFLLESATSSGYDRYFLERLF
jgi:hypothetical protein